MKLMGSATSPFVRKARVAAHMKGLAVEFVVTEKGQPKGGDVRNQNPLRKVPVLVLPDGTQLYDSHVICEYLDSLAPAPALFPAPGPARWTMLRTASLADGIMEAAILAIYEKRYRPEDKWVPSWVEMQLGKVQAGLAWLDANVPPAEPDYGAITVAAALWFVDNRVGKDWRTNAALAAWFDAFTKGNAAWQATAPPPA